MPALPDHIPSTNWIYDKPSSYGLKRENLRYFTHGWWTGINLLSLWCQLVFQDLVVLGIPTPIPIRVTAPIQSHVYTLQRSFQWLKLILCNGTCNNWSQFPSSNCPLWMFKTSFSLCWGGFKAIQKPIQCPFFGGSNFLWYSAFGVRTAHTSGRLRGRASGWWKCWECDW